MYYKFSLNNLDNYYISLFSLKNLQAILFIIKT